MTMITKQLADGTVAEFDSERYSPEVIDRYVADFNSNYKGPNVVPTGDTNVVDQPDLPDIDPSKYDDWGPYLAKQVGAAVQGTGRGLAGLGDIAISGVNAAGEFISNPVRQLRGEEPRATGFVHPLTSLYDEYAPAVPEGYQWMADQGEFFGPVAVMEAASAGLATPEIAAGTALLPRVAKIASTKLGKPLLKTPFIAETGKYGGEVGGGIAETLGADEDSKTLATIIGSAVAPAAAMPAVKAGVRKVTMDANSAAKLARMKRQGIDATFADVGTPGISTFQDVMGRGLFSGQPAFEARAKLYEQIEKAIIDNVATVRGRPSGTVDPATGLVHADTITPQPSTGQITKESIGGEIGGTSQKGVVEAKKLLNKIQEELLRDVGPDTSVDPTPFYDRMNTVLSTVHDAGLRNQLYQIVDEFDQNVPGSKTYVPPRIDPVTGLPPAGRMDSVLTPQPTFRAVQGYRSETGRTRPQGQSIERGFTDQAYEGMTEAMEETAKKQGVTDFGPRQAKTKELYEDIETMTPTAEAGNAGAAFESIFAGSGKESLEPLQPVIRQVPEDSARVLANLLDWKLRGAGRAGLDTPDPTSLNIKKVDETIRKSNPEHLTTLTGGVPEVQANLRDIGEIAHAEANRAGKRTVPGNKSTIGALTFGFPGAGTLGGLLTGALAHPGGGWESGATTAAYGMAGLLAGEAGTYAMGKLLTNPRVVDAIVNPRNPIGQGFRRAIQGASAEGANLSQTDRSDMQRQWEEELGRQFVK